MRTHSFIPAFAVAGLLTLVFVGCDGPAETTPAKDGGTDTGVATDSTPPGDTAVDTTPPANEESIDDMEGGTGSISSTKGRAGAWYTYNDGTAGATQTPGVPFNPEKLATPRGTSKYAAHSVAKGFTTWGAGFGFNLNDKGDGDGGSTKTLYDASAYTGITFWAKVSATSATKMRVNISTKSTDPTGGVCTPVDKCSDHYGGDVTLTPDWVKYTIMFADMSQQGWGTAAKTFETNMTYAVQMKFDKGQDFDVYVDDIAFIKK